MATEGEATAEAEVLEGLTENVRDQDELERDITYQANLALIDQEDERDRKRLDKLLASREKIDALRRVTKRRIENAPANPLLRRRLQIELNKHHTDIIAFDDDADLIKKRIEDRHQHDDEPESSLPTQDANRRMPNESQREFLIRTGKITPFSRMLERGRGESTGELNDALLEAEEEAEMDELHADVGDTGPRSHQNLRLPGFAEAEPIEAVDSTESEFSLRPRKKRRLQKGSRPSTGLATSAPDSGAEDDSADASTPKFSGQDLTGSDEVSHDSDVDTHISPKHKKSGKAQISEAKDDLSNIDDGDEPVYQTRLSDWVARRSKARRARQRLQKHDESERQANNDFDSGEDDGEEEEGEEWFKPSPDAPDRHFENDLKLPGDIHPSLFDYQKTGVQWLGELYSQQVGGIVGDEMGLGKTIQIISFVAGLHYSKKLTKPIIIVAPATVLRQWVNEFHKWWPPLRVSILHTSGSGMLNVKNERRLEDDDIAYASRGNRKTSKSSKAAQRIVDRVVKNGHVLVTTYAGLQTYGDILIPVDWEYAVLDEGHKIRNPNTAITIYCKELRTANRVILSGTPMQNNLIELWSLFDFVYPMRLGTLVNFRNQFEVPIKIGGYANATNLQIMTATKCAETLKDAISPYLLQRTKADVASDLPKKSEQVLFCKLTKPQRQAYEAFLGSEEMNSILKRTRQSLYGIDILRKICNHPDLLDKTLANKPGYRWGNPNKSGKMQVVKALLEMWKKFGHKTLLFSQGVQMLNILEDFVKTLEGFSYIRMDGTTAIKERQQLVDRFNNDASLHVFLLTTKVGGLGVNLTGANRVVIFDPDWNPSTDVQARERAWRLGQKKEVTIYRLMTAGTIEEKIYHRQIFKQFLTNKILRDPKQRQATFQMKDLYDLFTLGAANDGGTTETGEMFRGAEVQIRDATTPGDGNAWTDGPGAGSTSSVVVPGPVGARNPYPQAGTEPQVAAAAAAARPSPTANASTTTASSIANATPTTTAGAAPPQQGDLACDLLELVGVSSLEAFRGAGASPAGTSPAGGSNATSEESRLMCGIFARSGALHSALEHDHIFNNNNDDSSGSGSGRTRIRADRGMLEREARRVAAEAAAVLRRSGEAARRVTPGQVTWTGEVGETGRPQRPANVRGRRGLMGGGGGGGGTMGGWGSAGVLSNLAARQGGGGVSSGGLGAAAGPRGGGTGGGGTRGVDDGGNGSGNSGSDEGPGGRQRAAAGPAPRGRDFLGLIRDFLVRQGGSVPSQSLLVQFNPVLRTEQQVHEFKAMLRQIARLQAGGGRMRGRWVLKEEYREGTTAAEGSSA